MQTLWRSILIAFFAVGQSPAWALVCESKCMPQASLDCLRVCTKSEALLTQNGALPNLGQPCAQVEARLGEATLAFASAPMLKLPLLGFFDAQRLNSAVLVGQNVESRAQGPPLALPAQVLLSVPVSQAPPALV